MNKNILIFAYPNTLQDFHYPIFEDLFEEFADFEMIKINVFTSKVVRKRQYFIVLISSNETTTKTMFASL